LSLSLLLSLSFVLCLLLELFCAMLCLPKTPKIQEEFGQDPRPSLAKSPRVWPPKAQELGLCLLGLIGLFLFGQDQVWPKAKSSIGVWPKVQEYGQNQDKFETIDSGMHQIDRESGCIVFVGGSYIGL
jgi:hypothetical protein